MTAPAAIPARRAAPRRSAASGEAAALPVIARSSFFGGGRSTLGGRLSSAWEGLLAAGAAACPLCGARMERLGVTARCGGCGTTLE